ncbi:hypothetical protein [Micromonospora sp. NPDC048063]|uniref:hypothetical protein n=1 Tax=Micromonospora sp. NPDC048063 TaxID=3364256 RepID=UPI003718190A
MLAYEIPVGSAPVSDVVPAATFPVGAHMELDDHAVAPDLSRAVYAMPDHVACIDRTGRRLWQLDFIPAAAPWPIVHSCCAYSLDGMIVWVFRPDAMARGTGADQWLAVDAGTGRVMAQVDLCSAGHGGKHFAHPDGRHMLLNVGEGQDGSLIYRGRFENGRIELTEYPWPDRVLVDVAPGGRHFMTVDHDQHDAAFHAYPDGAVVARVTAESLGHDPAGVVVEWVGGYLGDDTAIVTVIGEADDEEEWLERYIVDPRTGEVRGQMAPFSAEQYDFEPLGDGSWLTTVDEHRLQRQAR